MGFFEGFVSGALDAGTAMAQRENEFRLKRELRAQELADMAKMQVEVNNNEIKQRAQTQLEVIREQARINSEMLGMGIPSTPAPSILQMDNETDVIEGDTSQRPALGVLGGGTISPTRIPQPSPEVLRQYAAPYVNEPDMMGRALRDYNRDMQFQLRQEQTAQRQSQGRVEAAEIQQKTERERMAIQSWEKAFNNKDSEFSKTLDTANNIGTFRENINTARQASRNMGVNSVARSVVNSVFQNKSFDAKALESAGLETSLTKAAALKPVSNDEIKLLLRNAPSPDNVNAYNQYLFDMLEFKVGTAAQKASYLLYAKEKGKSLLDAELAWTNFQKKFLATDPYFDKGQGLADGVNIDTIAADDTWKLIFNEEPSSTPMSKGTRTSVTNTNTEEPKETSGKTTSVKSIDDLL